jgi:hypothetical protein
MAPFRAGESVTVTVFDHASRQITAKVKMISGENQKLRKVAEGNQ